MVRAQSEDWLQSWQIIWFPIFAFLASAKQSVVRAAAFGVGVCCRCLPDAVGRFILLQ
jgi:hypothetical protein